MIIECTSKEGVTIGLIDTLMTVSHALASRGLQGDSIQEALADLRSCRDLLNISKKEGME